MSFLCKVLRLNGSSNRGPVAYCVGFVHKAINSVHLIAHTIGVEPVSNSEPAPLPKVAALYVLKTVSGYCKK